MPKKSLEHQEIVRLLAKLKEETPEYPTNLIEARKYSFMKQIIDLQISGEGSAGEGGQQGGSGGSAGSGKAGKSGKTNKPGGASRSGGSSSGSAGIGGSSGAGGFKAALGGGATFLGVSLKTVFAIGAVIVLITAAYLFRDQIVEVLAENELINTEETAPPFASTPDGSAQGTPTVFTTTTFGAPPLGGIATEAAPGFENTQPEGTPGFANPSGQTAATPNPSPTSPAQEGPFGFLQYLICVLQNGAENCR